MLNQLAFFSRGHLLVILCNGPPELSSNWMTTKPVTPSGVTEIK